MRFLIKISIPVEKFNAAVRDGTAGKKLQQILDDHGGIGAGRIERAHEIERTLGIALHEEIVEIEQLGAVGKAEHVAHIGFRDRTLGAGDGLIEERQAVAGRSRPAALFSSTARTSADQTVAATIAVVASGGFCAAKELSLIHI